MPLPRTYLSPLAAAFLVALSGAPALAQIRTEPPLSVDGNALILTTHGQKLVIPAPDWTGTDLTGDAVLSSFEAVFRTGDTEADLEIYRNGAIYALASELYGARIINDPAATLSEYRDTIVTRFSSTCNAGRAAFVQLGDGDSITAAPLLMVCGALRGTGGRGEITVMSLRGEAGQFAVIYQQWLGAAFDPEQTSTWPISADIVQARARQLQADSALSPAN